MENHFYHIRGPPLNVTIFITHVRNCVIGATPMFKFTRFYAVELIYMNNTASSNLSSELFQKDVYFQILLNADKYFYSMFKYSAVFLVLQP